MRYRDLSDDGDDRAAAAAAANLQVTPGLEGLAQLLRVKPTPVPVLSTDPIAAPTKGRRAPARAKGTAKKRRGRRT